MTRYSDVNGFVLSLLPELGTMGSKRGGAGATRSSTNSRDRYSYRDRSNRNMTKLELSGFVDNSIGMKKIKIRSKVDEAVWNELKALARERHQNVSGLLTEAISEYVRRKRIRPAVLNHLEASMEQNEELGKLLAR